MKKIEIKVLSDAAPNAPIANRKIIEDESEADLEMQLRKYDPALVVQLKQLRHWDIYKDDREIVLELIYLIKTKQLSAVQAMLTADLTADDLIFNAPLQDDNRRILQAEFSVLNDEVEGVERIDVKCPVCHGNKIHQEILNNRSGDEAQTFSFRCLNKNCNTKFRQKMA